MEDDDAEAKRHVVRDLLAGSIAAGTARMFVAPLDVVKIRFQVMDELSNGTSRSRLGSQKAYRSVGHAFNEIVQKEGFRALWKGNFPALFMIVPYGGIQFASYHYISRAIGNRVGEPYTSLIGGALSGMNATLFTYPLDLLRTRLAVQREPRMYKTFMDAVRTILADEGNAFHRLIRRIPAGSFLNINPISILQVCGVSTPAYSRHSLRSYRILPYISPSTRD
uniref:ADP,ATP carrier protein n=1 Tax=Rhodosorus marinus TaxID=101924 RepID=A0A7S2ZPH9_9RHOD|mmetsp:Transcript_26558/g.103417  ORF Transcript_26558/g.103417 Transcript_26558/m.103417 type:complete len:223 (+) Transcript_26558:184-852(+)